MSNPNKRCIETMADSYGSLLYLMSNPNKRCIETTQVVPLVALNQDVEPKQALYWNM